MINTRGSKAVLVDSDALIGLIHKDDAHHKKCLRVVQYLGGSGFETIVPYPIILESATTLSRAKAIRRPDLAAKLLKDYSQDSSLTIDDSEIAKLVSEIYNPKTSKKNTPFDFYILALAKIKGINTIFSFDSFYKKHGLMLAVELLSS